MVGRPRQEIAGSPSVILTHHFHHWQRISSYAIVRRGSQGTIRWLRGDGTAASPVQHQVILIHPTVLDIQLVALAAMVEKRSLSCFTRWCRSDDARVHFLTERRPADAISQDTGRSAAKGKHREFVDHDKSIAPTTRSYTAMYEGLLRGQRTAARPSKYRRLRGSLQDDNQHQ